MCPAPSAPSAPKPPPPPPEVADFAASSAAGEAQRKAAKKRVGRQSTIKTNPLGIEEEANVQKKTLLGE